jgi:hypothetical protein
MTQAKATFALRFVTCTTGLVPSLKELPGSGLQIINGRID